MGSRLITWEINIYLKATTSGPFHMAVLGSVQNMYQIIGHLGLALSLYWLCNLEQFNHLSEPQFLAL